MFGSVLFGVILDKTHKFKYVYSLFYLIFIHSRPVDLATSVLTRSSVFPLQRDHFGCLRFGFGRHGGLYFHFHARRNSPFLRHRWPHRVILFDGMPIVQQATIHILFDRFFMTGYLPVGFEFAAELTYPEPEVTSAGLLNASAQLFGIIFTILGGWLLGNYGSLVCNGTLTAALLVGAALTLPIRAELKRQKANQTVEEPKEIEEVRGSSNP